MIRNVATFGILFEPIALSVLHILYVFCTSQLSYTYKGTPGFPMFVFDFLIMISHHMYAAHLQRKDAVR